jgi:hypothetical protein
MATIKKRSGLKGPGKCIFCQSHGLSKEHIWADWLRTHLPREFTHTRHSGSYVIGTKSADPSLTSRHIRDVSVRPGDPYSQRLRRVCCTCNNGWMSILQSSVKHTLIPHLHGQWPDKGLTDQRILAAWASMFTMVIEFKHAPTIAVPSEQRLYLKNLRIPPDSWCIWIGYYEGDLWRGTFNHFGLNARPILARSVDDIESFVVPPNTFQAQSTAFVVGNLFIMTFSWIDEACIAFDPAAFAETHRLRTIWPPTSENVTHPAIILDDFTADMVSRALVPPDQQPFIRPAWSHA